MDTNAVEVIWTLVAVAGVGVHARGAWNASLDRATVLHVNTHDDAMRLLAGGRLRGELIRIVVDLGFAAIGVYAMFQPDAPRVTPIQYAVAAVFIGCVALLVLNAIMDDRERQLLRAYVSAER
jgi:hypothetical protein